jgi:phytoene dehydrogenase-like protein
VHLGGTLDEIGLALAEAGKGAHSERPFVILTQPTRFDTGRAPAGYEIAWAYCHVPHGSDQDRTRQIEAQVERFAPGFKDIILARHTRSARRMELYNENYVGGDINGGRQDLKQLFARPVNFRRPYATPIPGVYLCSASTPPGGGVHGMCGYHAARLALHEIFDMDVE